MRRRREMTKYSPVRALRDILTRWRDRELARAEQNRRAEPDAGSVAGDELDVASYIAEREMCASLRARDQIRLKAIDAAFERLQQGLYGICGECGEEISLERLTVLPFATNCIDCQTERETKVRRMAGNHRSAAPPKIDQLFETDQSLKDMNPTVEIPDAGEERHESEWIIRRNVSQQPVRKENAMRTALYTMMLTLGLTVALALASSTRAEEGQKATVRAGYLTCHVASGWGFIFGSSRQLRCAYAMQSNYTEYYEGSITKFGADIGYLQSGVILWAVVAPSTNLGQGALAGYYGGATASVALGVGGGANVLVGGFKNSIALQPVSVEGQNGLNVAAGVAELSLKFDKKRPAKTT